MKLHASKFQSFLNDRCSSIDAPLDLRQLEGFLNEFAAWTTDAIREAQYDPSRYKRYCIFHSPAIELLLMGWLPGQATPIHDHGQSVCGVRVLKGCEYELIYQFTAAGTLVPYEISHLHEGETTVFQGLHIHQVGNATSDPSISLHVYSPPLANVAWYPTSASALSVDPLPPSQPLHVGAQITAAA